MKKIILFTLVLLISSPLYSQIDDVLKKVKKLPGLDEWSPQGTVTTNINDAFPVVPWLGDFKDYGDPQPVTSFDLGPGYYRTEIQTYCLHAGTYGPTEGPGYLIAPLKGNAAELISNILKRAPDHPEVIQGDIQHLIWGIEAGVKFTDYPHDYQVKVQPLLTPEDMAKMNIDYSAAIDAMPDALKEVAGMYKNLRKKLVDPNASYQDLENIAVRNGIPPIGPGSKNVNPGNWTYMKDGFYIRTYPQAYSHSFVEIYRPAFVTSTRDEKNRLTSLEYGGSRMEIIYDDSPGMDVLSTSGNPDMPIWRIKTIIMRGPDAGNLLTLDNYPGWIVRDNGKALSTSGSSTVHLDNDPIFADYKSRVDGVLQAHKLFNSYKTEREIQVKGEGGKPMDCPGGDFDGDKAIHDGLKAATDPTNKKDQMNWIMRNLQNVSDWWNGSSDALAGGTGDCDNPPKKFNPSKHVSTPGNTNAQRLGMSARQTN